MSIVINKLNLKKYLSVVLDLEKNKIILYKLILNVKEDITTQKRNIPIEPKKFIAGAISKPVMDTPIDKLKRFLLSVLLSSIPIGIVFLVWWIVKIYSGNEFTIIAIILSALSLMICITCSFFAESNAAKIEAYKKSVNDQDIKVSEYERQMKTFKHNKGTALITINSMQNNLDLLNKQYRETSDSLSKFYSLGIIYKDYRNLDAVASFFQYLDSGRCTQLEGHEGAYNLYEEERRLNIIITGIDWIISNQRQIMNQLEQIRENQTALYDAICEVNETVNRLGQKVDHQTELNIKHNKIMEYNSRLAADRIHEHSTYIFYRDLLSGR